MNDLPRVLLTGFEPFGGETINPSWEAARALHEVVIAGHQVVAHRLPVVFGVALESLRTALDTHRPALVLAVGQAGGRAAIALERVAINLIDARIADNSGEQPIDRPIDPHGAPAHFSTLPLKAIRSALLAAGIPAELSLSAGSFVCNQVFYGLMARLAERPGACGGFVHIPYLPQQAARRAEAAPSMALGQVVDALRIAIEVSLQRNDDLRIPGGTIA